jgi:hypothetical protein
VTLDFQLAAFLTGIALLAAAWLAYVTTRDTLHPMIYLAGMAFFLHAFLPLYLDLTQPDELRGYLNQDQLDYAQTIVLFGMLSLAGGVWSGAHATLLPAAALASVAQRRLTDAARARLVPAGIALALLGLIAWIYMIIYSGGLYAVYGHSYGWFGADSGYVGEAFQLGLPGALLLLLARRGARLRPTDLVWIGVALLPLLGHGLLGARRGPTFMALIGVGVMWYLAGTRRPRLGAALLGGLAVGLLLLFLLANRNQIHLGAEPDLTGAGDAPTFEVGPGNEFVYGAGAALNAATQGSFGWGRRYLVVFLVRPIPRALWPTKYADAAQFLGIPSIDHVEKDPRLTDFGGTMGWAGAVGSAPGGIFDLWLEFSRGYLFAVFAVGWVFGRAWRKALSHGAIWLPLYALMTALSVYFVTQGLAAFAYRALLLGAVMWLAWRCAIGTSVPARAGRPYPASPTFRAPLPRRPGARA